VRANTNALGEHDLRADDRTRTDLDTFCELGARRDDSAGVD
jgi:hypothetical protein